MNNWKCLDKNVWFFSYGKIELICSQSDKKRLSYFNSQAIFEISFNSLWLQQISDVKEDVVTHILTKYPDFIYLIIVRLDNIN